MFSKLFTVLALTFSFSTFASDFKTTDNLTYLGNSKSDSQLSKNANNQFVKSLPFMEMENVKF